jgi:phosphohistidine phosphatase
VTSLHLLRHADAGDPSAWRGDDAARPLSPKGVRQAKRLGRHLAAIGFDTDAIVSSPKRRARETADIVAAALDAEVRVDERLAGRFGVDDLAALLHDAGGPQRPLLVGHDPDFSDVVSSLVGGSVSMRKGALARVDLDRDPAPGRGQLCWLLPPELLPRHR